MSGRPVHSSIVPSCLAAASTCAKVGMSLLAEDGAPDGEAGAAAPPQAASSRAVAGTSLRKRRRLTPDGCSTMETVDSILAPIRTTTTVQRGPSFIRPREAHGQHHPGLGIKRL